MTIPRKVTPEPYQPKPSAQPKTVPVEPKVKPAAPELKAPKMKPEPPKVEPAKKKPEAPKARGNVVELERRYVLYSMSLLLLWSTHITLK